MSSADHGAAHLPRCPERWFWRGCCPNHANFSLSRNGGVQRVENRREVTGSHSPGQSVCVNLTIVPEGRPRPTRTEQLLRACHAPGQPLAQGTLERRTTPWSAEEILDGQRQRVDIPAHARTAHKGLPLRRPERDLCRSVPHAPHPNPRRPQRPNRSSE